MKSRRVGRVVMEETTNFYKVWFGNLTGHLGVHGGID